MKYWLAVLVVLVAGGFGYFFWHEYKISHQNDQFVEFEKRYKIEMTADVYGGKTPQETLDLFIAALDKGDVSLAAKYFMLDDKLSREKWVKSLNELKNKGLLDDMAKDLKGAKPDLNERIDENDYKLAVKDKYGNVLNLISIRLNTYSQVWKIEDL